MKQQTSSRPMLGSSSKGSLPLSRPRCSISLQEWTSSAPDCVNFASSSVIAQAHFGAPMAAGKRFSASAGPETMAPTEPEWFSTCL